MMMTRLRILAWIEGLSFLVLVLIAMPLKHLAHIPIAVRVVGIVHGLAFVVYVISLIDASMTKGLERKTAVRAFWLALVPGGAFFSLRDFKVVPAARS